MDSNESPKEVQVETPKGKSSFWSSVWELFRFALIIFAIVIPIRTFVAQPFIVSGSSMLPTFENGEYLIVDEISYRFSEPKREDVVVFRYPNDPTKFFIKRIIGLPNETVDVSGDRVTITNDEHPSGFSLDQEYTQNPSKDGAPKHLQLKSDEYFVMGDNRGASSDSRYWGAVGKDHFMGKVFLRLFPFNRISILPGTLE